MSFPFVKGHGTLNDFVVLPDLDGSRHGELAPSVVAAICDRRGGIGADGVLRVLRAQGATGWFMDYRNADGSVSEMCGNGVRVFARYLEVAGLVDSSKPLDIDTRDGVKRVTFCDDGEISVEMGRAVIGPKTTVTSDGRTYDALAVAMGNPHAVAFVESLDELHGLRLRPGFDQDDFPDGVNVEFVAETGDHALAMRVFERGVGETASCGTGACAGAAAAASNLADSARAGMVEHPGGSVRDARATHDAPVEHPVGSVRDARATHDAPAEHLPGSPPTAYTVEVPGGVLTVTLGLDGVVHLKGPAVLVAEGSWTG